MKKKFDCVAMKRMGSRQIYERIKDLTPEQELAYWQERHRQLEEEQQAAEGHKMPLTNRSTC